MEITGVQIFLLVIVAAVVGMGSVLDSFQTHRPLIACTLVGIILGDVTTGVILGGTLEFIALGWMNIGAAQSPDSALASIISTSCHNFGTYLLATWHLLVHAPNAVFTSTRLCKEMPATNNFTLFAPA